MTDKTKCAMLKEWKARLEKWRVLVEDKPDRHFHLEGFVYGHIHFPEGTWVTTSRLVGLDIESMAIITKTGTCYVLGEVDPDYEKLHPGAKQLLLSSVEVLDA